MSYYKKIVSYIDLYDCGNRVKNIGYIKSEVRNEVWKLNVYLKGLPLTDTLKCEVKTVGTEKHLGSFRIERGEGNFRQEYNADEYYFNAEGLTFHLSAKRYGLCKWERDGISTILPADNPGNVKAAEYNDHAGGEAYKKRPPSSQQTELIDKAVSQAAILEAKPVRMPEERQTAKGETNQQWMPEERQAAVREVNPDQRVQEVRETQCEAKSGQIPEERQAAVREVNPNRVSQESQGFPCETKPIRIPEEMRTADREDAEQIPVKGIPETEESRNTVQRRIPLPGEQIPKAPGDLVMNLWGEAPVRRIRNKCSQTAPKIKSEEPAPVKSPFEAGKEQNISDDKWQQLCNIYPALTPFKDNVQGEFLSIRPSDFVILSENYLSMANNSFLLHGYYNYHHILLGRKLVGGIVKYYIGVPGIYHDREIKVALMFSFEAFEGTDGEDVGAFGYYMKEVKI